MIKSTVIEKFKSLETPLYYYDMELLRETLNVYNSFLRRRNYYHAHYALKANAEPGVLKEIVNAGFGADCVSGNEVKLAVKSGFSPDKIVYAGVGKSDKEIREALKLDIFCFNCESIPEIEVINQLAGKMGKTARIALRINPDIDAHTHKYISTGRKEDKFGISPWMFDEVLELINNSRNIELIGLHFHIGSQITDIPVFGTLCKRVEEIQRWFIDKGVFIKNLNLGGGLGVDYSDPVGHPMADFKSYFEIIDKNLIVRDGQQVHFEPGRAIVAQCGDLISRVLYVKKGKSKKFAILDAGMNDLIRPALYQASHKIENLSSTGRGMRYDVVGPICESSDRWAKSILLPETKRGDMIVIHSAGAYGQVMGMRYNQKDLAKAYYSDDLL